MRINPEIRAVLDGYDRRIEITHAFLRDHINNDIGIGALRLLSGHLPETCPDCGATCDYALGVYCSCWSEITPKSRPSWLPVKDDPDATD